MLKIFKKIIAILLIIGINWSAISAIGGTVAYFNDIEISESNACIAGTLDFSLNGDGISETDFRAGDIATTTIRIINSSTIDFQYKALTTIINNNDNFCEKLNLIAKLDGIELYNGDLENFLSPTTTTVGLWDFEVNLPQNSSTTTMICEFDFVFQGFQDNLSYGNGFSDEEKISNTITSAEIGEHLLITKVYYDPDDEHKADMEDGRNYEWVEIYNPTNNLVNLLDWKICDNSNCDILESVDIPSGKFAIIATYDNVWDYWNIPDDVIKIELNSKFGSYGLHNDGDSVILKNVDEIEVDAMSYGSDTYAFNPSCPDAAKGNMLGRVPVEQDTDTADDWKELGLPTVDNIIISPLQEIHNGCCDSENTSENNCDAEKWHSAPGLYYSQQLDIIWGAETSNISGDGELLIDIVYITDNDCSGDISSGDNSYAIASNELNDGIYIWEGWVNNWNGNLWKDEAGVIVPYFYGLTWIKITANGQENFIISDFNTSIAMFEPLPPGVSLENICSISENSCSEHCSELEDYPEIIEKVVENFGDIIEKIDETDKEEDEEIENDIEGDIEDKNEDEDEKENSDDENDIDDIVNIDNDEIIDEEEIDKKNIDSDEEINDDEEIIETEKEDEEKDENEEVKDDIDINNKEMIDESEEIIELETVDEEMDETEETEEDKNNKSDSETDQEDEIIENKTETEKTENNTEKEIKDIKAEEQVEMSDEEIIELNPEPEPESEQSDSKIENEPKIKPEQVIETEQEVEID